MSRILDRLEALKMRIDNISKEESESESDYEDSGEFCLMCKKYSIVITENFNTCKNCGVTSMIISEESETRNYVNNDTGKRDNNERTTYSDPLLGSTNPGTFVKQNKKQTKDSKNLEKIARWISSYDHKDRTLINVRDGFLECVEEEIAKIAVYNYKRIYEYKRNGKSIIYRQNSR